jgi:glycosyltransferase involved in cell wall biosynthesis
MSRRRAGALSKLWAAVGSRVRGAFAAVVVGVIYSAALMLARGRRRSRRAVLRRPRRLAVVGTFYNGGWFLSHATPLARSGVEELIVVTDEAQAPLERVRFLCPAPWTVTLFGRTIPKLACVILAALWYDPDLYMGYHIMPCSVMALVVARMFGRPASYQMTGGPVEVLGGGALSENSVLCRLGRSRRRLEGLAIRLIREFDQVVVRGASARRFLVERGVAEEAIAIIPGSVDPEIVKTSSLRTHDLVFVGRLVEIKQPLQLVQILAGVIRQHPSARVMIVGDGPLRPAMEEAAAALGVGDRIDFVGKTDQALDLVSRGRVFVLTSRTEGLSIAMAEAMMAGVVPVVANVGDLGDLVRNGVNGYLVEPNDIEGYVERIAAILADPLLWSRLSAAATGSARSYVGVEHVTALWRQHLELVFGRWTRGAWRRLPASPTAAPRARSSE